MTKDVKEEKKTDILSMKEFLEKIPPGKTSLVSDLIKTSSYSGDSLNTPVLLLHCNHDDCNGLRYFEAVENGHFIEGFHINNIFLIYICKNCGKSSKLFALSARKMRSISQDKILKYGEHPPFGPPIPSKAITLIRPDRELLFTGYRAENQGMGIGAFVYYRRVVENQKNSIFDEIIKVTKKLNPDDPVIKDLENAKKKKQFSTAVEEIKQALPQILLIKGYIGDRLRRTQCIPEPI